MSRYFPERMREIYREVEPYIVDVPGGFKWKEGTPDRIKELHEERLRLDRERKELEMKLLFPEDTLQ